MLNLLLGAALGFLSGLGVGGGSLLLLWLTVAAGVEQSQARIMNLMFFLPCAIVATLFRRKQGCHNWRIALPAIAGGLIGCLIGNCTGWLIDTELLKKAFGVLFIACGLRELFYKQK